jgi:ABC-type transport system involved in Fe-S cluster assembly fused permease/ATPase subunit
MLYFVFGGVIVIITLTIITRLLHRLLHHSLNANHQAYNFGGEYALVTAGTVTIYTAYTVVITRWRYFAFCDSERLTLPCPCTQTKTYSDS